MIKLLVILLHIFSTTSESFTDKQIIDDLLQWASTSGGIVDNVKVGSSTINGAGRALITIKPVQQGHVLVSLPLNMLITDEIARSDQLIQDHVLAVDIEVDSCMTVTLYLMLETLITQSNSKWIRYYRSLPPIDHLFNLPQLEWRNTELGRKALSVLLTSPSMAQRVKTEIRLHESAIRKLNATVFRSIRHTFPNVTEDVLHKVFLWAKSTVLTRSWTKAHSSIQGDCTLVPILDLLNHDDSGGGLVAVAFENDPNDIHSVGVLATQNVNSGAEVVDSYDPADVRKVQQPKCMQEMLLGFGFLPFPSQRSWCFDMTINIKTITFAQPALNRLQHTLLAQLGTTRGSQFTTKLREGDIVLPPQLLTAMRLCTSGEREMLIAQSNGNADQPLTMNNERKVLKIIHNVMHANLLSIPSSDLQDEELISKENTDEKMKIALQVRIHERAICRQTLEHISTAWHKILLDDRL